MGDNELAGRQLAEIAAWSDSLPHRGEQSLAVLRRVVPFDSAWLALVDPSHPAYTTLADTDLPETTRDFLAGPVHARELELAGTTRPKPPQSPSDEGLAVALCGPGARHIGFLAVMSADRKPPSPALRRDLGRLIPVLGRAADPMRSLVTAAQLIRGAHAGAVNRADGELDVLPGLVGHALLVPGSSVVALARAELHAGGIHRSFLWPLGGRHALGGHARITVLARAEDLPVRVLGIVLVSPPDDLHGLTARELEVLELIVRSCSNQQIARVLVVAQRTVAAHVEHILAKLSAATRTSAAVRAERAGLYVPLQAQEGQPP